MRRVLLALLTLFIAFNTFATNYWWVGGTAPSAEFRDQSNWSIVGVGGAAVGASGNITFTNADVLTIDGTNVGAGATGTINVTNAGATVSIGQLILTNNANFRIKCSGSTRAYNVGGSVAGTDLDLQAGSTLVIGAGSAGTSAITLALAASNTASIAGILDIGNQNSTSLFTIGTAGNATVTATGIYRHGTNSGTLPAFVWSVGSTCEITGLTSTSPGTTFNQTFHHVIWNCTNQSSALGLGGNLLTINGNFTVSSTGTQNIRLNTSGSTTTTVGGNLNISGGTLVLNSASGGSVNLTVNGNCNISAGILTHSNANNTGAPVINLNGNLNISGTGILDMQLSGNTNGSNNGIVNLKGDLTMTGGSIVKTGTGTGTSSFNFAKSGTQVFSRTGVTTISGNMAFVINSGSTVDFGTSVLDGGTGTFTVSSGGGIITAHTNATGALNASGANGAIQLSGTRSYSSAANYTFNGSSAQVTGNFLTATSPTLNLVNNLTINNSAGVSLTNPVTVSNQLNLTSGALVLGTNNLTIAGSAAITGPTFGATATSYVVTDGSGALVIQNVGAGGRTGAVLFPVGTSGTSYNPATIDNSTGTADDISVGVSITPLGGIPVASSLKNTWTITDATPGGNNAIVNLQWNGADENTSFDRSQAAVVRTNGAAVTNTPAYAAASGSGPYTKASESGITTFATGWSVTSITSSPLITLNTTGFVSNFGNVAAGGSSTEHTYIVSGSNLTANLVVTAPANFKVSTTSGAGFGSSVSLTPASGTVSNTTIYVIYTPATATGASGSLNITNASTGAVTENVPVNGNAIATEPTTTGSISFGATTGGSIVVNLPTVGNGAKRIIVVKQGAAVNYLPADGAAPTGVSADFSAATDQGSGNKIVYDGTGSGLSVVTVTGLSAFTTYHFAVFEYNEGTGTSQNYYTGAFVTGNQATADGSIATDYYRSVVTGNWGATTTWESSHDNTTWMPATLSPNNNANTITISNGTIVTLTADVTADQLTIDATGRLNINAATTLTVADGTGTDLTINGYVKNSGTITATGTISATATGIYEHNVSNINPPLIAWATGSTLKLTGTYVGAGVSPTGRLTAGSYQNIVIAGDISASTDYISLGDNAITVGGKLTISTTGAGAVLTSAGGTSPTVAEYEQTSGIVFINRNSGSTRSLTVTGNATLSGGTLHIKTLAGAGAGELNIGGNLNVTGGTITNSATAGSTVIRLNGVTAQTATFGTPTGVINYVINNATGVTLGGDLSANGTFTFTAGNLVTGSNKLIISGTGSIVGGGTGGWVVGNLQKNVATGATTRTFEIGAADAYRPVAVTFSNVTTAGDIIASVSLAAGDHPNIATSSIDAAKSVNRYWTLTNSGVAFDNYSATFNFLPTDVDATANTANFITRLYSASAWTVTTAGTLSATSIQATGITAFGDFAVGEAAVVAGPTVTTQPSNASICAGANASFTSASTSLPAPTVQWERSPDGIAWTTITGTLDGSVYSNFTTGTLNITGANASINNYQYRAVFTNGNGSATSNAVTLTVKPIPAMTSAAAGTICSGVAQNYTLTSNVSGATFSWSRAAVVGISNTALTGQASNPITEALVNTTSAPVDVTYALTPTANGCPGATFNYVVTVNAASVGGTVASPQTVCIGSAPSSSIVLSGNTGSVVKWQKSSDAAFTSPSDIAITSATLSNISMGQLTQNTYFRAVVQSASCAAANSASVLMTVNSTVDNTTALAGTAGGGQVCATYDVAASNNYMSNCKLITTVSPAGGTPVAGNITACVYIHASVQNVSGEPYVQRVYSIQPTGTGTANVTLYFLQSEFDAFNAARNGFLPLPVNGSDATGIANVRVDKFSTNSISPGGFGGTYVATSVTFDAAASRWVVTLNGVLLQTMNSFFIHTGHWTLPVTLVNFKGEQSGEINKLTWSTATETNNKGFELERSLDGIKFTSIAFVASKGDNGNSSVNLDYGYNDKAVVGVTYYRLKQVDRDGKYNYSNVVTLTRKGSEIVLSSVYPNPATSELNLKITSPRAEKLTIVVTDLTGKVVMQRAASVATGDNIATMNVSALAAGSYIIKAVCANGCETAVHKFVKQ